MNNVLMEMLERHLEELGSQILEIESQIEIEKIRREAQSLIIEGRMKRPTMREYNKYREECNRLGVMPATCGEWAESELRARIRKTK